MEWGRSAPTACVLLHLLLNGLQCHEPSARTILIVLAAAAVGTPAGATSGH